MSNTVKKKRIFHIAKELNISHLEIIQFLDSAGISSDSHMTKVEPDVYEKILAEFSKEKLQVERLRKEKARKVVASSLQKKEEKSAEKIVPKILKTPKSTDKLELTQKLKDASNKLRIENVNKVESKDIVESDNIQDVKKAKSNAISNHDSKKLHNKYLPSTNKETSKEASKEESIKSDSSKDERKLKKFSIADIADKINKTSKNKSKQANESKVNIKHALSDLGKRSTKKKEKKKEKKDITSSHIDNIIEVPEFTTVDELAQTMRVKAQEVIMKYMQMGMMVTINQRLDNDSIVMIADEFGFEVKTTELNESNLIKDESETDEDLKNATPRHPVVTIMGHVDHGKTSLLDFIRDENVVAGESGGITQHIGAYKVKLKNRSEITFLDTPGHAAFTAMRARGAQITDIVIIIIAADDDVMPQTIEAIDHAKAASVPIIIAINKIDSPNGNIDKIKKSLSANNILVEDWGGKYQCSEISAKTGSGIDELMDKILLEAEMLELKSNKNTLAKGAVIESRLDKGLGPIATILIQKGTLKKGDIFICGTQSGKVRAVMNERNTIVGNGLPSDPVQVLGFREVANAGESFIILDNEREAKKIATERSKLKREAEQRRFKKVTLDQLGQKISDGEVHELAIIIKGDVDGSIEALSDSLMDMSTKEVKINIIHRSVGMITENDVSLAAASNAIILAFNVNSSIESKNASKRLGVEIRSYTIIYEVIKEVKLAMEGLLSPDLVEKPLGIAEVREQFKIPKIGIIAGCYIKEGKVIRNALLRVKRKNDILHEGKLTTLKRFKDDVSEVGEGFECGISVSGFSEYEEGDTIEVYEIKEVKRSLA